MKREHSYQHIKYCSDTVWPVLDHHLLGVCLKTISLIVKSNHLEESIILTFPEIDIRACVILFVVTSNSFNSFKLQHLTLFTAFLMS